MRRPRRSAPALAVAMALAATCGLVAVALTQRLFGEPAVVSLDLVATRLHGISWSDTPVIVAGVSAAAIGALLLWAALYPGRPVTLTLVTPEGITAGASRHGLRRSLHEVAEHVDGVSDARLRLHRRRVRTRVRTRRTVRDGLAKAVRAALEQRLDEFGLTVRPKVKVTVRGAR